MNKGKEKLQTSVLNMKLREPLNAKCNIGESNVAFFAKHSINTVGDLIQINGEELVSIFKKQYDDKWLENMIARSRVFAFKVSKNLGISNEDIKWYKDFVDAFEMYQKYIND